MKLFWVTTVSHEDDLRLRSEFEEFYKVWQYIPEFFSSLAAAEKEVQRLNDWVYVNHAWRPFIIQEVDEGELGPEIWQTALYEAFVLNTDCGVASLN